MADNAEALDGRSYGVALHSPLGCAYNEEAFRYLLTLERKRSERSGHPFLLLLVDLKAEPGSTVRIDREMAEKIFSSFWLCLRETDSVGWYREERIAGAVLTELTSRHPGEICREVAERVNVALSKDIPLTLALRLQASVYQLGPKVTTP